MVSNLHVFFRKRLLCILQISVKIISTFLFLKKTGAVRLRGGKNEFEGIVEIYLNGVWGTICSSQWDDSDASVICQQLELG